MCMFYEEIKTYKAIEQYKSLIKKKETEIDELEIVKDSLIASLVERIK